MNLHLFVYGTLLSGARHPMGERLRREASLAGEAVLPGRLYRIARYPGLVEGDAEAGLVHGEVYRLNSAATLKWLDAYEGIVPGQGDANDYERVERTVRLAAYKEIAAWVYLYRKPVDRHRLIEDGRWLSA